MNALSEITVYIDFKSPYAYLAKDPVADLAQQHGIGLRWLPYILDIPAYLGSARLDESGRVIEQSRNAHQWRRVKYSYMDCRRQAQKRGLTIRGTTKIWESSLAAAGMLHAARISEAAQRRYIDVVFERFWRRDLDIEDPTVIAAVLTEIGADGEAFPAWAEEGRQDVRAISEAAEARGVFGVPTFVIGPPFVAGEEIFWGGEHLADIGALLAGQPATAG